MVPVRQSKALRLNRDQGQPRVSMPAIEHADFASSQPALFLHVMLPSTAPKEFPSASMLDVIDWVEGGDGVNREIGMRRVPIWLYLLVLFGMDIVWFLLIGRKNIDQIKERFRPGPGAKDSLCELYLLLMPPSIAHYVAAWLDRSRLHWSDRVPLRIQIAGLAGLAASIGIVLWARTVNPFYSSVIRIQRERRHYVVTGGPYQYVRHPGYLASILWPFFSGLALSSWLSILVGATLVPLIVRRTIIEDRVLQEELEGYRAYAEKVRYRLIPGVW